MTRASKSLRLGAIAATFALGLGSAFAADPIKIGSVVSATGPASFLGDPEARTLKMQVEAINKAGGVNGRPLELVLYDDGGDANKARTFATRLVEDDKVVAMVGGTTTGTTMAMIPFGPTCSRRRRPTRSPAKRSSPTCRHAASRRSA
jgi:branched-chain amino acid transport system substrate-binding protein